MVGHSADVVVGQPRCPDPDRGRVSVDQDIADARQAAGNAFAGGAAVVRSVAEDHVGLFAFGHPQRDADREQVAQRKDFLARILHRADHDDPGGAALRQQQGQGRGDLLLELRIGDVGGERGDFVDEDDDEGVTGRWLVQAGDAAQPAGAPIHDPHRVGKEIVDAVDVGGEPVEQRLPEGEFHAAFWIAGPDLDEPGADRRCQRPDGRPQHRTIASAGSPGDEDMRAA